MDGQGSSAVDPSSGALLVAAAGLAGADGAANASRARLEERYGVAPCPLRARQQHSRARGGWRLMGALQRAPNSSFNIAEVFLSTERWTRTHGHFPTHSVGFCPKCVKIFSSTGAQMPRAESRDLRFIREGG
ncbi:hypothetical protein SKAU_G00039870 [Synaphobranchus kaupii]|uniref:Uncharacterized protein n=1 Tax=Synaphobranchus kaupii TaxID=118154 RepID=A0A9Q1GFI9_SYNKA|nr:hypothetical protein SKAU_G00039870 [Synaphobranchus kaupii]